MEVAPIPAADAKALNAKIPFVTRDIVSAAPFIFTGSPEDRARARDCLAAAMLYEAGDSAADQRPVAQVIINRARHPAFPKSICGVVFQGSERRTGCQFTFTCDGALNRRYSDAAWIRAQALSDAMLSGLTAPEVGLATHYHTDWVRPYWSDSLEKIAAVKTHLFFRWPGFWGTPRAFRGTLSGIEAPMPKMAQLSPMHALALAAAPILPELVPETPLDSQPIGEPRIVQGAPANPGSRETILVVLDRKAPPESYVTLALRLCGSREFCKLMGWTNPALKPAADAMSDMQREAMSFSYLRDDKAGFEKALWNCTEHKRDDARQCMKR